MSGSGSIDSGRISPANLGLKPDVSPVSEKSVYVPPINRQVRRSTGGKIKRPAPPRPPGPPTNIQDRHTTKVPADQVKTVLPRPQSAVQQPDQPATPQPANPSPQQRQLSSKLDNLSGRLEKLHDGSTEVTDRSSASGHKSQVKTMESQVKQAKATVNELHSLIKEMESAEPPVPQDSIMRAKGKALTARKTLGTAEFKLRDAKAKLEFFNYHKKQTSELGKKQRSLKNDFAQLDVSINKNANSSKEHQVVVKFYEKQVSIAKSALSNADKLMKAEGKAHENKVDMGNHFRSEVQDIKASIKNSKLPALQRQLKAAKKNLSEAKHRENNEKQQELKQKKQEKQEAARRKAEEQQEAAQRKARQHQPDQTRKHQAPTKPPAEQQKAAAPAQTNQQRTSNDSRAKRVVKAITPNMQNFLRGVKGMSATAVPLRTVMRMAQTPNDFKQALADIRESVRSNTIDKQTAARLRSQLCQQAATKMSNPDFVKKIDSVFVRHMMYGQHQEKMLDNYAASVETLAKRLPRG